MEKVMTAELREQLMGLLPFSSDATLDYMPAPYLMKKGDTEEYAVPEQYRPTFTLRAMTRKELDELKRRNKGKVLDDSELRDVIAKIVVGWTNLWDIGPVPPQEIPYKADPAGGSDKDCFARVPAVIVADIAMMMVRMNGILGTESLGLRS